MSLALTCFRPKPSLQLLDNSVLPENRVHQLLCDVLTGEQTSESMPSAHTHPQANCAWTIQANKDPKEVRRQTNCWQCPCHRNHRHLRLPKFDMFFLKNSSACFWQHPVDCSTMRLVGLGRAWTKIQVGSQMGSKMKPIGIWFKNILQTWWHGPCQLQCEYAHQMLRPTRGSHSTRTLGALPFP